MGRGLSQNNAGDQWLLFGFDVRRLGHYWKHAWAQFLWGDRSPVRERLDEVVLLNSEEGAQCYHVGQPVAEVPTECQAVLLPEALVLFKTLRIPRAAEDELDAVMALEVDSNSPFPGADTVAGWGRLQRDEQGVDVQLAITSRSAAMRYLGQQFDIHDIERSEVWAQQGQRPIVLRGFGERRRLERYKRRLQHIGGFIAAGVAICLVMVAVSAATKYLELHQYQGLSERVIADTKQAAQDRSLLAEAGQTIAGVDAVAQQFPNPHVELARLTRLLGDDVHIVRFSMTGDKLSLRGRAANAAAVMEKLSAVEDYAEVADEGGITRLPDGTEQFYVRIQLGTKGLSADAELGDV